MTAEGAALTVDEAERSIPEDHPPLIFGAESCGGSVAVGRAVLGEPLRGAVKAERGEHVGVGTALARSFELGAQSPWKRVRLNLGGGTRAAILRTSSRRCATHADSTRRGR